MSAPPSPPAPAAGPGLRELPAFVPASQLAAATQAPLKRGPNATGVYLFRDARGEVMYVGKARRLRRRVLDHLHVRVEKDGSILARSASVEFVPTDSEREALLLEAALVRQYQPPYNTFLKDDKSYPYLAVTIGEEYPRILLVRRPRRSWDSVLFGPYTSAREARGVQRLLSETFQLRRCVRMPKRACLYYHIKTCSAPCIRKIDRDGYDRQVIRALTVLRGRGEQVRPSLEAEMRSAAERQDFERAAHLRDALGGLQALSERQHVVGAGKGRVDVVALAFPRDPGTLRVAVGLVKLEDGEVIRTEPHLLSFSANDLPERGELLHHFLVQYYGPRPEVPEKIYLAGPRPAGVDEAVQWLEAEKGVKVKFRPTGRMASLARLADRQARTHLDEAPAGAPPQEVLEALANLLNLPEPPVRIEGIDISIFQGAEGVGSLVVFENGRPNKDEYRRFRIRGVEGTNDFAMVAEVVRRRYARRLQENAPLPGLLLIDGGAGQLQAAENALAELGIASDLPAIGLAKREEQLYLPDRREPVAPNPNAPPMLLLRAVRDEAHRFAVTYHRTRRRIRLREAVEEAFREQREAEGDADSDGAPGPPN